MSKRTTDIAEIQDSITSKARISGSSGDLLAWMSRRCTVEAPCTDQRTCKSHMALKETWSQGHEYFQVDASAIHPRGKTNKLPRLTDDRARKLTQKLVLGEDEKASLLIELVAGIAFEAESERGDLASTVVEEAFRGGRSSFTATQRFALKACLQIPIDRTMSLT